MSFGGFICLKYLLLQHERAGYGGVVDEEPDLVALRRRFAANLRRLREKKGMCQGDLADAAEVAHRTIRGLEAAHYSPSFKLALKLAKVLECDVADFFAKDVAFEPRPAGRPRKH